MIEGFNAYAKTDIHSLMMWMLTIGAFGGYMHRFGWREMKTRLLQGMIYFLVLILISGILEHSTGIHIRGTYTELLDGLTPESFALFTQFLVSKCK